MADSPTAEILVVLSMTPGLTAREIAFRLGVDKSTVNSHLYRRSDLFFRTSETRPRWWPRSAPVAGAVAVNGADDDAEGPSASAASTAGLPQTLFAWQEAALNQWDAHGFRGVVEAVTGSGKTRVGLAAALSHVSEGWKVAVLVPGIPLLEQWETQIREWMPHARVGRLGDGGKDNLSDCDVLVAVRNSAARHELGLADGQKGLLIADECHRYSGDTFKLGLEEGFERRLGLTATYEQEDGEHDDVLTPYFGGVVFRYGYADAVGDGVIAPFRVALVPVSFTTSERAEYDTHTETMRRARSALLNVGAPSSPFPDFMKFVLALRDAGTRSEGILAGRYLKAMRARQDVLASTRAKIGALSSLHRVFRASDRSIVFTETIPSAETCADVLVQAGVVAEALHSDLPKAEQRSIIGEFAAGAVETIVAPRLLDEGIDVPEADLAVIVAASRKRRQMVQRMGRVLRRKTDGRAARFVILFVEGTTEDPGDTAHEAFLNEIMNVAEDIQEFPLDAKAAALLTYLAP